MFTMNEETEGTRSFCKGMTGTFIGLVLKEGEKPSKEIWSGHKINTVTIEQVECILIRNDISNNSIISVKPTKQSVTINIPLVPTSITRTKLGGLHITQFPIISNTGTTGHKLQGTSKDELIVLDFNYSCQNWIYVVLSRVRNLRGLYLKIPLQLNKVRKPSQDLLRENIRLRNIESDLINLRRKDLTVIDEVTTLNTLRSSTQQHTQFEQHLDVTILVVPTAMDRSGNLKTLDVISLDKYKRHSNTQPLNRAYSHKKSKTANLQHKIAPYNHTIKKSTVQQNETICQTKNSNKIIASQQFLQQHQNKAEKMISNTQSLPNTVLFTFQDASVSRSSFVTLNPNTWLNDEVINFYITLLNHKSWGATNNNPPVKRPYVLKTHFMSLLCCNGQLQLDRVRDWTFPDDNFNSYSHIICPININNLHWSLVFADLERRQIFYLDSLNGRDGTYWIQSLYRYLIEKNVIRNNNSSNEEWVLECSTPCAKQHNSDDCGVYTCLFAYCLMNDCPIPQIFQNTISARFIIAQSILNNCIIPLIND
jgi:hypothetical protein